MQKISRMVILVFALLMLFPAVACAFEYPILPGGTNPLSNYAEQLGSVLDKTAQTLDQASASAVKSASVPAKPANQSGLAAPNRSAVLIDGKEVAFDAYTIYGYNYFKLRDLAIALNGSAKQFEVSWDGAINAISLMPGDAYTPRGGELLTSIQPSSLLAFPANSAIIIGGKEVAMKAYSINSFTYFKLRDLGVAMEFGVSWDAVANSIKIDTMSGDSTVN
ncbi:MAG: hypothetical protein GYA42_09305 [Syntrophomonadaceae bacterium]|nr:hypothetical protein [Syntrophomonadaceae bacterium]